MGTTKFYRNFASSGKFLCHHWPCYLVANLQPQRCGQTSSCDFLSGKEESHVQDNSNWPIIRKTSQGVRFSKLLLNCFIERFENLDTGVYFVGKFAFHNHILEGFFFLSLIIFYLWFSEFLSLGWKCFLTEIWLKGTEYNKIENLVINSTSHKRRVNFQTGRSVILCS